MKAKYIIFLKDWEQKITVNGQVKATQKRSAGTVCFVLTSLLDKLVSTGYAESAKDYAKRYKLKRNGLGPDQMANKIMIHYHVVQKLGFKSITDYAANKQIKRHEKEEDFITALNKSIWAYKD